MNWEYPHPEWSKCIFNVFWYSYLLNTFQRSWIHLVHEVSLGADIVVTFVFDEAHTRIVSWFFEEKRKMVRYSMTMEIAAVIQNLEMLLHTSWFYRQAVIQVAPEVAYYIFSAIRKEWEVWKECEVWKMKKVFSSPTHFAGLTPHEIPHVNYLHLTPQTIELIESYDTDILSEIL